MTQMSAADLATYESRLDADLQWALREGSMHFEGSNAVHKTLQRLTRRLDELGIDYAIAGAMAMFFHGYRRFTEDVDVLVTLEGLQRIHEELEGRGYVKLFEKGKNLRDADSRVKIDFLITGQFPGTGKPGPVAFPNPKDVYEVQQGIRVVKLPKLLELKLASGQDPNRQKDLGDAQELIREFNVPDEWQYELDPSLRGEFMRLWRAVQEARESEY
jgi:hypothetical protein